ncbi:MAG TPA: TIGR03960 family B12-binding radical SAM protein [Candidatus Latescibacteria bacterium]|nr:TIGR03960 family B12-binding radical SAM protein [Candidatus Latescibacterota bacterium]
MDMENSLERILPLVSKPNRYVGNELNLIRKDHRSVDVKIALAYPDVYEIGQSYLGFGILYHILNKREDTVAERVFAPWPDMERQLRAENIPLSSLESHLPLRCFDLIGFTLQYELNFTNVLTMLDLAGVPLYSAERGRNDPLILGGGPCAFNPEPLSDFFDAFVIGDGEEVIGEIVGVVKESRGERRTERLKALAKVKGVYVPSLYSVKYDRNGNFAGIAPDNEGLPKSIESRVAELKPENYPPRPLVPLTEITHDRFSVEVMRGCTRGCRFCRAGMIYRPVRERSVQDLIDQIEEGLTASGWDEVSLVSLSTSDYGGLQELISRLDPILSPKKIALSLPSMRMDNFSFELARSAGNVRKTGLTFAPEAGTRRLRDVINKNLDEEDMLKTLQIAYASGWKSVKLYFMIGLPTETQQDLDGMVDLVRRVASIGGKSGGRKRVNLSISPFSPKPHTPFQWEAQDDLESLREKSRYLKERLTSRSVRLRWRQPEVSFIETIFARGDRRLSRVLFDAWSKGARFDSWSDLFKFDLWLEAFASSSVDPWEETRARDCESPLPWDHIFPGVSKEFLKMERLRASEAIPTVDCRSGCANCGLGDEKRSKKVLISSSPSASTSANTVTHYGRRIRKTRPPAPPRNMVRLEYTKGAEVRFISHLDLIRVFQRSVRRAGLPIAYSEGFHPHPKISFGPPLALGMEGEREYLDLQFAIPHSIGVKEVLNLVLPSGIRILDEKPMFGKAESLDSVINVAEYSTRIKTNNDLSSSIRRVLEAKELVVQRGEKAVNIRPAVKDLSCPEPDGSRIRMRLAIGGPDVARPLEVLGHLLGWPLEDLLTLRIKRTALWIDRNGKLLTPMEVI